MDRRAQVPVADAVCRYEAGASLRDLAGEYGVAVGTVRDRLLGAGVRLRRRGAVRVEVDVYELVYEVHLTGSGRAAARNLGVDRRTASRRLAERHSAPGGRVEAGTGHPTAACNAGSGSTEGAPREPQTPRPDGFTGRRDPAPSGAGACGGPRQVPPVRW